MDPLKEKAESFAAGHFDKVHILTDGKVLLNHLASRLLPSSRHLFVVECPTSRAKVLSEYLDLVRAATDKVSRLWGRLGHNIAVSVSGFSWLYDPTRLLDHKIRKHKLQSKSVVSPLQTPRFVLLVDSISR